MNLRIPRSTLTLAAAISLVATEAQAQDLLLGRLTTAGTDLQLSAGAEAPAISPDGRYVVFVSTSTNLAAGSNGSLNVYRYDIAEDRYDLAMSNFGTGNSTAPSISIAGTAIAFESLANNIGGGTPSGFADVFYSEAFDAGGGDVAFNTYLVSRGIGGAAPNGASRFASIAGGGRFVAFHSDASNLVASDTNAAPDIFVGDADTLFGAPPERVSVDSNGAQINGPSRALSPSAISNDGRYVAFAVDTPVSIDGSIAGNLEDVFVRDRTAGTTSLVSKSTAGIAGNSSSDMAAISPDGRYVVFRSFATNLVANPTGSRIYLRDRIAGTTTNMPLPPGGERCEDPRVANTADIVSQCSFTNSAFQQAVLYRPAESAFFLLSTSQAAAPGNGTSGNFTDISADGNLMVFDSAASDLVASDTNNATDSFVAVDFDFLDRIFSDSFE